MSEAQHQDGTDRRSLVEAFVHELRGPGSRVRMVPRALTVSLAVVVVGAGAVGIGMMAEGGSHSTDTSAGKPAPAASGPAASAPASAPAAGGAPGGTPGAEPPAAAGGAPGGAPPSSAAPAAGAPATNPAVPQANNVLAKPAGFTVVAGYGCGGTARGSFSEHGRTSSGPTGWVAVGQAGWASDGCNGTFDAMPMSGSATKDDGSNYAVWSFSPGTAGLAKATCQVQLYVPNDHDQTHVGGDPAHFQVYGSADASGSMLSDFDVDQLGHLGQWKPVGTFAVTKGTLSIKLGNRGLDWHGSTVTNAHLAVAQFRASCT